MQRINDSLEITVISLRPIQPPHDAPLHPPHDAARVIAAPHQRDRPQRKGSRHLFSGNDAWMTYLPG